MRSLLVAVCLGLPVLAQETESSPPPAQQDPQPGPRRGGQPPQEPAEVAPESVFRADHFSGPAWRNLGPANPVGRITDIAIHPRHKSTWYIGTGGGGVWKTDNGGTTWQPVFDRMGTVSIGDVAIAPSNPNVVWIGTGEENARNSVQWGDGVYRSADAGKTWKHVGLRETFQIGHIEIHPTDPDTVYVAALGRLWGPNAERGVYKTTDGGRSWARVFQLDDKTGVIDVRLDPSRPEVVYACAYERMRDKFDSNDPAVRFGEKAGLYRSMDGGGSWQRLQNGLPTNSKWGRSGLAIYDKDPTTLFLIVETERSGWATGSRERGGATPPPAGQGQGQRADRGTAIMGIGSEGEDGKEGSPGAILTTITPDGPAATAGIQAGDRVVKMNDEAVKTYADLIEIINDSRGGDQVTVTVVRTTGEGEARKDEEKAVALTYGRREAGGFPGGGSGLPNAGRLNGQIENRQDRQGEDGFQTGGIFRSNDRGETWTRVNSLTERPFYYSVLAVDPQDSNNLYSVGTTMWGSSDGGKRFAAINRGIHVDFHAFWVDPTDSDHLIAGCDGGVNETWDRGRTWQVFDNFCVAQFYDIHADNQVPYHVYGGLQDNGTWRGPSRTRNREGIFADDWFTFYGGDGFGAWVDPLEPWLVFATSQNGAVGLVDMRSGSQARIEKLRPGDSAARFNWDTPFFLSPHNRLTFYLAGSHAFRAERYAHLDQRDTRPDQGPIRDGMRARPISPRLGLGEQGTAVAFAESPRVQGLLYVGTDDGALWRSEDGGAAWEQIQQNVPGMPGPRYVSKIWPSSHRDNRVYVTFDGHRFDDFRPYLYVSEDRGKTWRHLADDFAAAEPIYCVAEDPRNSNLLFAGTEFGCYASLDRGARWFRMGRDLPTVAVRDIFIHDRDADLVIGTHGRGAWICDMEPLRQFSAALAKKPAALFRPEPAILWRMQSRGVSGHRDYRAPNPAYGAAIYVNLDAVPADAPTVTIHDITGAQVAKLTGRKMPGLQLLQWDGRAGTRLAAPGAYSARWQVGGETLIEAFELLPDPSTQAGSHGTSSEDR